MNGFESELKERILGSIPQAKLSNQQQTLDNWQQRINALPADSSVIAIEPIISAEAIVQSTANLQGVSIQGVFPEKYASKTIKDSIYSGQLDSLQASQYHIIIGQQLARQLDVTIGDKVRIISTRGARYTPLGQVPSQRNFTVSGLFNVGSDVDSHLILMHVQDAARLIRIQTDEVTDLRFYFTDPFAVENWQAPELNTGETLIDWRSTHGELFAAVKMDCDFKNLRYSSVNHQSYLYYSRGL